MEKLKYIMVSDISKKYPFLEVFSGGSNELIMEIDVTDNKELCFRFYPSKKTLELSIENWEDISRTAKEFLPKVIKNEEDYERLSKEEKT